MQKAENTFAVSLSLEILLTLCYNDTVKKYRVIPEKEKEMKKRIFALLVAAIMVVSVLALASCDVMSMLPDSITSLIPGLGGDKTCDTHTDANGDEKCDNCGMCATVCPKHLIKDSRVEILPDPVLTKS